MYQDKALSVPEKKENKFIVHAFPRKFLEIFGPYEKLNVATQFPFDEDLFSSSLKIKTTKRENKDSKRNKNLRI